MCLVISVLFKVGIRVFFFWIILGSCVRDAMTANRGSLLTTSNLIRKAHIIKKRSIGC